MINTPEQALEFVENVMIAAQKARSIISEIAEGDKVLMGLVADLNPGLFEVEGKVDIIHLCQTYINKAKTQPLTRTDIVNVMSFVERIGPTMMIEITLRGIDWPDGGPIEFMRKSELPLM